MVHGVLGVDELLALKREIDTALDLLIQEYRIGVQTAYEPQVVEAVAVASTTSDPTLSQARAHQALRGQLRQTSTKLRRISIDVQNHRAFLLAAFEKDEASHGAAFDPVRFPPSASLADIAQSAARQLVRRRAGDPLTGDDPETRARLAQRPLADILSSSRKGFRR